MIKTLIGQAAAKKVPPGCILGLGSGSTAEAFIVALSQISSNTPSLVVASSKRSAALARHSGLFVKEPEEVSHLDLYVDGADEIDSKNCLIKGGGGCLLREKLLAYAAHAVWILVDESKCVANLGKFGLPLELEPFALEHTLKRLRKRFNVSLRQEKSDGNHAIGDIRFDNASLLDMAVLHRELLLEPGVIETGFFPALASCVWIGRRDGRVDENHLSI